MDAGSLDSSSHTPVPHPGGLDVRSFTGFRGKGFGDLRVRI